MILLPLSYSTLLYLITGNIDALAGAALISVLIAGVSTAALAGFNIAGVGENASGTIIIFILIFGGVFYGVDVSNMFGKKPKIDAGGLWKWLFGIKTTSAPNLTGGNLAGGIGSMNFPYAPVVAAIFGMMYALGLFLLISDRGGES